MKRVKLVFMINNTTLSRLLLLSGLFLMGRCVFASYELQIQDNTIKFESVEFTEGFYLDARNYFLYGYILVLKSPLVSQMESVELQEGEFKLNVEKNYLTIQAGSLNQNIAMTTKNGQKHIGSIIWTPEGKGLFLKDCPKEVPLFRFQKKNPIDLPIGYSCVFDKSILFVIVSMPTELEIVESTLVEVEGKGERWKKYLIPTTSEKGGVIAKFKFQNQSKAYSAVLVALEIKKNEEPLKASEFPRSFMLDIYNTFGLGLADMNYATDSSEFKNKKYVFKYVVISKSYFDFLKFGGNFKASLMSSEKSSASESVDLKGFAAHIGYYRKLSKEFEFGFRPTFLYYDFQQSSGVSRAQSSLLNFDCIGEYILSERQRFNLVVTAYSVSSGVTKKHSGAQINYKFNLKSSKAPIWLGAQVENHNFNIQNSGGGKITFVENEILVTVEF